MFNEIARESFVNLVSRGSCNANIRNRVGNDMNTER